MQRSLQRLLAHEAVALRDVQVSGLTSDSRAVKPGFIFAAMPGTKNDGARFIPQALQAGASAIIVARGSYEGPGLVIEVDNPRQILAHVAARFYDAQPDTIVAVTGTNGKTSVAVFVRQIWTELGFRSASLGTIGIVGPHGTQYLQHTTPDPVQLQESVAQLASDGVDHLAIEASSHGLEQYRLDGLRLTAGAFTNLTRDHLDYHGSFDAYFEAKMRLFTELLPQGAGAIINADSPSGEEVHLRAEARGLATMLVGHKGRDMRLLEVQMEGLGQRLKVQTHQGTFDVNLPLAGDFQASNALVAAGLVIAAGGEQAHVFHALASLKGAPGRMDLVGQTQDGASVFVDYAHTPDAVATALLALRPTARGKLVVVLGCGGDRDKGKRPLMAKAAADHADKVIITDDNPRSEDPAMIRRDALAGAPSAMEIGDRATAIRSAVDMLKTGDILLVAGKGHELGQTIGAETRPFSDHDAVRAALAGEEYHAA
jgi:UDP-N-acetylmuramoyl-L-alanyl-D-glutamate--2,6-diaminopimelate ligase